MKETSTIWRTAKVKDFSKSAQSVRDKDYQFALLFQEAAKKIEIIKQVQSIVINSERLVCPQGRVGGARREGSMEAGLEGGEIKWGRGMKVRLSKKGWERERETKEIEMRKVTAALSNQ